MSGSDFLAFLVSMLCLVLVTFPAFNENFCCDIMNVLYLSPLPLLLFLLLDAGGWILQHVSSRSLTVLRPCCSWSDFYVDSCFYGGCRKVLCIEMYKSACSFPRSCWVLLFGFSKLAACVIQYFLQSLFLSMFILYPGSSIEQACGTVTESM